MKLFDFMTTPKFCGESFLADSWAGHRIVARLIDGDVDLLTPEEYAFALKITGRTTLKAAVWFELFLGWGRGAGKTRFAAVVFTWLATQDYRDRLAPGEVAVCLLVAPTITQAEVLMGFIYGLIHESPILRKGIKSETTLSIDFKHRTRIEVTTSSYRTVRGRTLVGACLDEVAFMRSDESSLPDKELYRALLPALNRPNLKGRLIALSSPHRKVGLMWEMFKKYHGNDAAERGLYLQADSKTMNPLYDQAEIDEAYEGDPEAAASEYGARFRSDIAAYLADELIDAAIVPGRTSLAPRAGTIYCAFADPASGAGADSMTAAIGHAETVQNADGDAVSSRLVIDRLMVRKPPFNPKVVVAEFCAGLAQFGLTRVVGDKWAKGWPLSEFAEHGITYEYSERDASAIYGEAAKLFAEKRVELLDDAKLLTQFRLLERRVRSGGLPDRIDHPNAGHDDMSVVVAGVLSLLAEQEQREAVIQPEVAIAATQRPAPDERFMPRVLAAVVDGDRVYLAKRMGSMALETQMLQGGPQHLAGMIASAAHNWSAASIYIADTSPGVPVLKALRDLNFQVFDVDVYADARDRGYADLRAELAFSLARWLRHATVPAALLHDLTAVAYTTRRGSTELLDRPLGLIDALALTLLDRNTYQDPRTVLTNHHIQRTLTDDGRWGGPEPSRSPRSGDGPTRPYHLGDREPSLYRDGWSRCIPAESTDRSLCDYDPLNR